MNGLGESLVNWIVPTTASLALTALGGAVIWGQYGQRVTTLEAVQRDTNQRLGTVEAKGNVHDTQIAVINQKLDTIIQQVAVVNSKLDRANK